MNTDVIKAQPRYPYQERVRTFAFGKPVIGLFVYYGGGKTYLSLDWKSSLPEYGSPTLVLCNKSLLSHWEKQVLLHTTWTPQVIAGTRVKRLAALKRSADLYICTYDVVRSKPILAALAAMPFKSVIADESTYLKESRTQRFKNLYSFCKKIPYRAILSGKPITEDPMNIWSQMLFLDDGVTLGSAFWHFRHKYFAPGPPWRPYDWVLRPGAAEAIADALNYSCIRIEKKEVKAQLPPQVWNDVILPMPEALRTKYDQLIKDWEVEFDSGTRFDTMWAMGKAGKLHQLCQGFIYRLDTAGKQAIEVLDTTKLDWIEENVPIITDNGAVLIWTAFRAQLTMIQLLLAKLKIPTEVYHGGMNTAERALAETNFKSGKAKVLLVSQQTAYAGLDLWHASYVIFASSHYSSDMRENAEERSHRSGSEIHDCVTYYDLLVEDSIDTAVRKAHRDKSDVAEEILKHIRKK